MSRIVPPNSFALARSVEYFKIPRDVLTICVGKSTYARCGIIVNVTPFEPEWEGFVTLEISNTTPLPATIYANEGLCQIIFFQSDEVCEVSYADRKGQVPVAEGNRAAEALEAGRWLLVVGRWQRLATADCPGAPSLRVLCARVGFRSCVFLFPNAQRFLWKIR